MQLILSLEKRLTELSETLKKVRDGFLEKSADLEALQRKADDQVRRLIHKEASPGWILLLHAV